MALTSYCAIGDIKGGCTQAGDKLDKVLVYSYEHNLEIPSDANTGAAIGSKKHKPYKIVKAVDKATSDVFTLWKSGKQVTVTHDLYRINASGVEEKYFTTTLENAIVVGIKNHTPDTFADTSDKFQDMEEVTFTYSKITKLYIEGNLEAQDGWDAS
ncbi:type VI secretion system tube protein TssD [Shewanella surugensis]|uniref:Type VI secretion system tube protein Hcp n=1 Tax=Shewanella surugensis TaxID=212020 RepID=A0ABT0L6Z2_9GAMM|nr:type VI secretion system tube protein TssD [Shewanella surugensis]MCL1123467.1 type VI secretion system tube protein Hcp [Shewanella surugensis]